MKSRVKIRILRQNKAMIEDSYEYVIVDEADGNLATKAALKLFKDENRAAKYGPLVKQVAAVHCEPATPAESAEYEARYNAQIEGETLNNEPEPIVKENIVKAQRNKAQ